MLRQAIPTGVLNHLTPWLLLMRSDGMRAGVAQTVQAESVKNQRE